MILFSKILLPPQLCENCAMLNLTSQILNIKQLRLNYGIDSFIPIFMDDMAEINFDTNVHYDILNNQFVFRQLFEDILIPYNSDIPVIIMIHDDSDLIVQSFIKFLNLRYAIQCKIINTVEDFYEVEQFISSPIIDDPITYDYDLSRYYNLLESGVLVPCPL